MVTEEQKYDSGVLRNLGFAFLAPLGSIIFQTIVFKKHLLEGNFFMSIMVGVIGCILLYLGKTMIKEKSK